MRRRGTTLLEVTIVLAIILTLVGVMLGVIQSARRSATLTVSLNNLRQISLATHQLADSQSAGPVATTQLPRKNLYEEHSIFFELIPFIQPRGPEPINAPAGDWSRPFVRYYLDSADPSLHMGHPASNLRTRSNYVCNMLVFGNFIQYPATVSDGQSNTIGYTQHYFLSNLKPYATPVRYDQIFPYVQPSNYPNDPLGGDRRASFADAGWRDVLPARDPTTGRTFSSVPGLTFQVRPPVEQANTHIPSSPHAAGLPVAMLDGSVRTLRASMDESTFWSLVTPNWGDVPGDW